MNGRNERSHSFSFFPTLAASWLGSVEFISKYKGFLPLKSSNQIEFLWAQEILSNSFQANLSNQSPYLELLDQWPFKIKKKKKKWKDTDPLTHWSNYPITLVWLRSWKKEVLEIHFPSWSSVRPSDRFMSSIRGQADPMFSSLSLLLKGLLTLCDDHLKFQKGFRLLLNLYRSAFS